MIIIKYIFLVGIFLGVSSVGILISKKYKNRVEELKNFKEVCNILESKIKFTYEPLGDIFEEISDIVPNNIGAILKRTKQNLSTYNFKKSWELAIEEKKRYLSIKEQDISVIKGLGNMLRKNRYTRTIK